MQIHCVNTRIFIGGVIIDPLFGVDTGSIETTYKVYVYPITNGAKVEFKNVIVE